MSMSAESLNIRRKRTATERATNNGDPLAVRKKAREATGAPVPKKSKNASVSRKYFLRHYFCHGLYRQITLVAILLSVWMSMMKRMT